MNQLLKEENWYFNLRWTSESDIGHWKKYIYVGDDQYRYDKQYVEGGRVW